MLNATLAEILGKTEGVKSDGANRKDAIYLLDPMTEATIYAGIGNEILSVAKVIRIELGEKFLAAETQKGERFYLDPDAIKGLKLERLTEARRDRAAGFTRA